MRDLAPGATWPSGWSISNPSNLRNVLLGAGGANIAEIPLTDVLTDGEVLTSLTVRFAVATGHGSVPANQPKFVLTKHALPGTNTALASVQLSAIFVSQYENGGAIQSLAMTGLSVTIDKTNNTYVLQIVDEWGTGAQAGNQYLNVVLNGHIVAHKPF